MLGMIGTTSSARQAFYVALSSVVSILSVHQDLHLHQAWESLA